MESICFPEGGNTKVNILNLVEKKYFKTEGIPDFRPGDTLRVHVKVKEGVRERIQVFEGIVIGRQHGGLSETFTVPPVMRKDVRARPSYQSSTRTPS